MKKAIQFLLTFLIGFSASSQAAEQQVQVSRASADKYEASASLGPYVDLLMLQYAYNNHLQLGVGTSVLGTVFSIAEGYLPPLITSMTYYVDGCSQSSWYAQTIMNMQGLLASKGKFHVLPPVALGYSWKLETQRLSAGVLAAGDVVVPNFSWGIVL